MNTISSPTEARILVIDDTPAIHDDFRKILCPSDRGASALLSAHESLFGKQPLPLPRMTFEVDCVAQGQDGLVAVQRAIAEGRPYAVAFVDVRMPPGWDGIETTRHLWTADPDLQIVICTAYSDRSWEDTITELGPTDSLLILKKPFDNIEVLQLAHALSTKWSTGRRDRERLVDLDERVRARTLELQQAEGRFTKIFNANPIATALLTIPDGRFLDANPAFIRLAGHPVELLIQHTGTELNLWVDASTWTSVVDSVNQRRPLRCHQARLRTIDGALRDVLISVEGFSLGTHLCVLVSLEDVSERLLLEEKFRQAQKMEAVGQLAAGVAHDFNNLLTVIQSYTELTLEDRSLAAEHVDALGNIRAAAERASALTRQLLVFTRRQISHLESLDLGEVMNEMRAMLRRLIPEHITLDWICAPHLPPVLGDKANLEQVVMNLVVNARDAMPEGGRLFITVTRAHVGREDARRHPDARPGHFVQLSITDTGTGMSAEVRSHLFEPFFTTKGVGKGTGLGLSTVYAIVRQHAGWIEVASRIGQGTRFDLFLPIAVATAEPTTPNGAAQPSLAPAASRGERILLVEDEPSVRRATKTIMSRAGYEVTEAEDPPSARHVWHAAAVPFDLLVTDMVMPNGTGAALARELREQHADLKVIITTGYSRDLLSQQDQPPADSKLLLKPFAAGDLLSTIRNVLDGNA